MATATEAPARIDLEIEGMTCASCAARIERKLNKLEGVEATVNYATEEAAVSYDPAYVAVTDLIHAVEAAGYRARSAAEVHEEESRARTLAVRLLAAAVLTVPLALLAMIAPLQFAGWEWFAAALSTPVVLLGRLRLPPRRGAQRAPRGGDDGHADLDRHARRLGLVDRRARRRARRGHLLRGRRRDHDADPARALPRGARAAPLGRGDPRPARARRQGARVSARRARGRSSRSRSSWSATSSSSGRARRSRPTASSTRAPRRSTSRC